MKIHFVGICLSLILTLIAVPKKTNVVIIPINNARKRNGEYSKKMSYDNKKKKNVVIIIAINSFFQGRNNDLFTCYFYM